jgi:DNA adenine methylase
VQKNSILRWSGSKAKLIPALMNLAPAKYERYIEPFAGSASLYFELLPLQAIVADVNPCVIDVYQAIKSDASGVADMLDSIPRTREAYYSLRALTPDSLTLEQRAARLIFLMKACFNGVYRTNRLGQFNVPMGDKIYALPTRQELLAMQNAMTGTSFINGDFGSTLAQSRPDDWIYLDPPYRKEGRYRGEYGYNAEFTSDRLVAFVKQVKKLGRAGRLITISYSHDNDLIDALKGWNVTEVSAKRTVSGKLSKRETVTELIFTNYSRQ